MDQHDPVTPTQPAWSEQITPLKPALPGPGRCGQDDDLGDTTHGALGLEYATPPSKSNSPSQAQYDQSSKRQPQPIARLNTKEQRFAEFMASQYSRAEAYDSPTDTMVDSLLGLETHTTHGAATAQAPLRPGPSYTRPAGSRSLDEPIIMTYPPLSHSSRSPKFERPVYLPLGSNGRPIDFTASSPTQTPAAALQSPECTRPSSMYTRPTGSPALVEPIIPTYPRRDRSARSKTFEVLAAQKPSSVPRRPTGLVVEPLTPIPAAALARPLSPALTRPDPFNTRPASSLTRDTPAIPAYPPPGRSPRTPTFSGSSVYPSFSPYRRPTSLAIDFSTPTAATPAARTPSPAPTPTLDPALYRSSPSPPPSQPTTFECPICMEEFDTAKGALLVELACCATYQNAKIVCASCYIDWKFKPCWHCRAAPPLEGWGMKNRLGDWD